MPSLPHAQGSAGRSPARRTSPASPWVRLPAGPPKRSAIDRPQTKRPAARPQTRGHRAGTARASRRGRLEERYLTRTPGTARTAAGGPVRTLRHGLAGHPPDLGKFRRRGEAGKRESPQSRCPKAEGPRRYPFPRWAWTAVLRCVVTEQYNRARQKKPPPLPLPPRPETEGTES